MLSAKGREQIYSKIRGTVDPGTREGFATVYCAYLMSNNQISDVESFHEYIDSNLDSDRHYFIESEIKDGFRGAFDLGQSLDSETLKDLVMNFPEEISSYTGNFSTSESLAKLVISVLGIKPKDRVLDIGCGMGSFLYQVNANVKGTECSGIDINAEAKEIASIKAEMFSPAGKIICGNMFEIQPGNFNEIFSEIPLGTKPYNYNDMAQGLKDIMVNVPGIDKVRTYTWPVAVLMMKTMPDDGIAAEAFAMGSTFNLLEKSAREYFINKGYIKYLIKLPTHLSAMSGVQMALAVFTRKKNDHIRIIDASDIYTPGRRQNTFSEDDIRIIVQMLHEDGEKARNVALEEIEKKDYSLDPATYLGTEIEIKDGVRFGSIIKNITRGAQFRASELDKMVSKTPTPYQYMMLANIQDGLIDGELPYLTDIDDKNKRYLIHDRNLLLSKNGAPYKVAIASVKEGQEILGNGNLYIIELDENKADPYFIKAFLESEEGSQSLQRCTTGAAIPNIPVSVLKDMIVPLPSLEKQHEIATEYKAKEDEIRIIQSRLQKAKSELKEIYKGE